MPAELQLRPRDGKCWIREDCRDWFGRHGLQSARDFLALPGVVVSGHVGRNVSRVQIGDVTAYLKREHRVRRRDRWRSFLDGFGFASMSQREAKLIHRLELHDLPCPRILAAGRDFLLLEAAIGAKSIRDLTHIASPIAQSLGKVIAKTHNCGIDQPDLFAKHFLIDASTGAITILDWQRATLCKDVSWQRRIASLAALQATAWHKIDAMPNWWLPMLTAYLEECQSTASADLLGDDIWQAANALRQRSKIKRQLTSNDVEQPLVRINGETICVIPELASDFEELESIERMYDPRNHGKMVTFANGKVGTLRVGRHSPTRRILSAIRQKGWRSPELKLARVLFHLERHGIVAPKLLAYGQICKPLRPARSFVVFQQLLTEEPRLAHIRSVVSVFAKLHDANVSVRGIGAKGEPFGVLDGNVVVANADRLRVVRRLTNARMTLEEQRMLKHFEGQQ